MPFPKLNKTFRFITSLGLTILAVIVILSIGWRIFLAFYQPRVLTLNHPIQVERPSYSPGDQLHYTLDYCKSARFQNEYSEIHYSFVNGAIYPAQISVVHSLPPGCNVVHEVVTVPEIPEGEYTLEMIRMYQLFSASRFVVQSESDKFRVIKGATK